MMSFATPRPRRRPSLTPMIDVVFLLLIFFMLAARMGQDSAIGLALAGTDAAEDYQGLPRLVHVAPDGLRLNGQAIGPEALPGALADLTEARTDAVVVRAGQDTGLQRVVDVMTQLNTAGFTSLILVE